MPTTEELWKIYEKYLLVTETAKITGINKHVLYRLFKQDNERYKKVIARWHQRSLEKKIENDKQRRNRGNIEVKYDQPMLDGRRKLHPDQYEDVREAYKVLQSQRKVAEQFGCSRRLITFILNPEKLKAMQDKQREEQHWKKYYSTEERKKTMQQWRAKKKALGYVEKHPNSQ